MIERLESNNTVASPLISGLGILYSVLIVLALALIVLLIVSLYRKRHGYKDKTRQNERDERQWWANPYDISNMMSGEEQPDEGNFSIEPIPEDKETAEPVFSQSAGKKEGEMVCFCRKCGKRIPNDSLFCQYCGAEIKR